MFGFRHGCSISELNHHAIATRSTKNIVITRSTNATRKTEKSKLVAERPHSAFDATRPDALCVVVYVFAETESGVEATQRAANQPAHLRRLHPHQPLSLLLRASSLPCRARCSQTRSRDPCPRPLAFATNTPSSVSARLPRVLKGKRRTWARHSARTQGRGSSGPRFHRCCARRALNIKSGRRQRSLSSSSYSRPAARLRSPSPPAPQNCPSTPTPATTSGVNACKTSSGHCRPPVRHPSFLSRRPRRGWPRTVLAL